MTSPVARIGMSLAVVLTVGLVATNASQVTLIRVLGHAALATPFLVWCVARGTFWRAPQTGICSIAIAASPEDKSRTSTAAPARARHTWSSPEVRQ